MQGKVVVITGASQGIGASAAEVFAAAGAKVVLLARSEARITALAEKLGGAAMALRCDVSVWPDVAAAVEAVTARFGRLDVWIGNAGVIEPIAKLAEVDPLDWAHSVAINLNGVLHGLRAVLPVMRSQGGGTVITLSSGAAHNPLEGWGAYCAAKAGAAMLTR
nr:SDR family NAD(P)-dependent oxidoreductase [Cypionkella sp.]